MHELSLCNAIAGIVGERAGERRVTTVHLQIGQLRQVVPDTLVYCWGLVVADTALAGSRIEVDSVPAELTCRSCSHRAPVGDQPVFRCAGCSGTDVSVSAGEEFLITSLELAEA